MATTWAGWEADFQRRAGILVTPPNNRFLASWAKNSTTNCTNNPIDLALAPNGGSNCAKLRGVFPQAKRYHRHSHAAAAFDAEVHHKGFGALLRALNSGNPYQVDYANDVASVLVSWGSDKFANVYLGASAGGGPPGGGAPTGTHKGWDDLTKSLGKKRLGHTIAATYSRDAATLRALKRAYKV